MKRTILFFIATVTTLFFATGCCNCRQLAKSEKPLVGTTWQLVQIMARDVQPEGDLYTLTLHDNGTFYAKGECNIINGGTYRMSPSRELNISYDAMTLRACRNQSEEREFFSMLSSATHYEMDGSMMLLLRNGELIAIMQAAES